jgi:two-component system OmpR family response regulator
MRVLIVEDEADLASVLKSGLSEERHAVDVAENAEMALEWIEVAPYDAIVLDVMLSGMSGIDLCRHLRANHCKTPILLLTARDSIEDRVAGLDSGADDYLVKPFAFAELLARLRALNRRPPDTNEPILRYTNLALDSSTHQVWLDEEAIHLSAREFQILEYLLKRPGYVATRRMIADGVWDYDFPNVTNVIDVHIRSLRLKLNDPVPGKLIQSIRGVGYRLGSEP